MDTEEDPRDPRVDPRAGDVLYQENGTYELHVDKATSKVVACRIVDSQGNLLVERRMPIRAWRDSVWYVHDGHREIETWTYKESSDET